MRASTYGLMKPLNQYIHPLDVLRYIQDCYARGEKAALCVVTGTQGGSVRAPGALLAVHENGGMAGYLSNGCVDADLILQAQSALKTDQTRQICYGAGSPFKDIILPCGGGVDVFIHPAPDMDILKTAINRLESRTALSLRLNYSGRMDVIDDYKTAVWEGDYFCLPLMPVLRLHIAGQGAEVMTLSDMARAVQWDVMIETADKACLDYAADHNLPLYKLETPKTVRDDMAHDAFTAFVMLFHDHDWEGPLLKRALAGDAFYIGAMGSRATHARRREMLEALGVPPKDSAKIHAPIGLIPASRNAVTLAISIMAEITHVFTRHIAEKRAIS